jgi:hypothetical protein
MLACGSYCRLMLQYIFDLILSDDVVGQERINSADPRPVADIEENCEEYRADVSHKHVQDVKIQPEDARG